MIVKMPEDMVEGKECLDLEVPWQVPESVYKEDVNLQTRDRVMEFGSGGSTLFFARRCNHVISVETNEMWFMKVANLLTQKKINNIEYYISLTEEATFGIIDRVDTNEITVLSVDPQGGINRSKILSRFLSMPHDALRMIVLDNYGHPGLFPDHYNVDDIMDNPMWEVFTFNHDRWAGQGTRIYIKKDFA